MTDFRFKPVDKPLVSIVMPSLNQARFLEDALASALGQDYGKLELIVADGGSTDGTQQILARVAAADSRLRWYSEADTGPANAVNKALARVRGTVIGWLNSDDLYTPGAISRALSTFDANPEWLMVYGHGEHVDESGKSREPYPTLPPGTPITAFAEGCFICQPTVFFRRTQLVLLGKLDEDFKCAFDFEWWLRAFRNIPERIGFVDQLQAQSRLHDSCITVKQRRAVMLEGMRVLHRHLGSAPKNWVQTFVEELVSGKALTASDNSKRDEALQLLEDSRALLDEAAYGELNAAILRDPRLAPDELLAPSENAALAMAEYRSGALKVRSTPKIVTLETTSRCNLRCVMCPHAIDAVNRPKHLDEPLVASLASYIKRANVIQLHGIGEPTISPAFWRVVPLLPPPEACDSMINTNLTQLGDERLDKLLNSNLRTINVSLDAASPATYAKIRGFDLNVVVANLEKLIATRNARAQAYPKIYLNMTLMRSNIEELADFIRLAARLQVDWVYIWHLNRWTDAEMARYVVERDGWVFDYAKEGLWNFPKLSNSKIEAATRLAKELGLNIHLDHNKEMYFDEESA